MATLPQLSCQTLGGKTNLWIVGMTEPILDKQLTIKCLQYLSDTGKSILAKREVGPNDCDSLSRELDLFRNRASESHYVPDEFKQKLQSIQIKTPSAFWDTYVAQWLRFIFRWSRYFAMGRDSFDTPKVKLAIMDFCGEIDRLLATIGE